jgi:hypothetical protein
MAVRQGRYKHKAYTVNASLILILLSILLTGCVQPQSSLLATATVALTQPPIETPTLTNAELGATKVAEIEQDVQRIAAIETQWAQGTPFIFTPIPIPTSEPMETPIRGLSGCGSVNRTYDFAGCWAWRINDEYLFVQSGVRKVEPSQGILRVYTTTLDQLEGGPEHFYDAPSGVGRINIAHANWPEMTLIELHEDNSLPSTTLEFNLLTRSWEEPASCQLYPLVLNADFIGGLRVHFGVGEMSYGATSSDFGWLDWTGPAVSDTLASSLTPPGDSDAYINPDDPQDHTVSVGDWVAGRPEVSGDQDVDLALSSMRESNYRYVFPLWDQVSGDGDSLRYRISGFAWASLEDFSVGQPNTVTMRYWGQAMCPNNP